MQFSFWPAPNQSFEDVLALARHVERSGWDGIWYADHFMPNAEDTHVPWPEAWTTLSALGALVPRLRIGPLVIGNTYRHPAVLAKMAVTLDHITNGRVTLGLGSGWQENEHRQYGIAFNSIGERLSRLDEACQVIRSLFEKPTTQFRGTHYQLEDAVLEPKPRQQPLPLLIGGGGERVTLKLTARYADAWNVWGDVALLKHKMHVLDRHCENEQRDPAAIHRTAVALLFMGDDEAQLQKIRDARLERPHIVGTPAQVRDIMGAYAEAGVDEFIVPDFTLGPMTQKLETLDQFIHDVAER